MIEKVVNVESLNVELSAIPEFAFQVYSTVPLDPDHTALCQYLSREIDSWPKPSFEIYGLQPDVFACVEHQRREIFHRKRIRPAEASFPGIAKAVPNGTDKLFQGFLLVITSHSYRTGWRGAGDEEKETGPLWVNFNRSFPLKTEVDVFSRLSFLPGGVGYVPPVIDESDICPERDEIVVRKCRYIHEMLRDLKSIFRRSHRKNGSLDFDYGINEDEGDTSLSEQPPAPEVVDLLYHKSESLPKDDFIVNELEDSTVIMSNPVASEPDLQYIIYITFPHSGIDLASIARAFTYSMMENIPCKKTINFEFRAAPSQSLSSILAMHKALLNSRPDLDIGAYQSSAETNSKRPRAFPQDRCEECDDYIGTGREPYRTFFVILDRPDFLTAPGVLFFLTDGNELWEDWREKTFQIEVGDGPYGDYRPYQVWRSAGMPEVARRLAMLRMEREVDSLG